MIEPTIGRVVWYYPDGAPKYDTQPLAAIVAFVHNSTEVTIGYFSKEGHAGCARNVRLVQDDEQPDSPYCCWMPYQKGQAAKTEALEAKVKGK